MSFISLTFLMFCAITFLLYFVVPIKVRWIVLLLASLVFYAFAGIEKLPFVVIAGMIAYLITLRMDAIYQQQEKEIAEKSLEGAEKKQYIEKCKKRSKRWLVLGITLLISMLIYVKAGTQFLNMLDSLLKLKGIDLVNIIVPLGISYYSFSLIGYMADVYWRKEKAEHNYFKLLLYMIYFPHILQGPIPRHKKLQHQLIEGHKFDYKKMCFGLQLAIWGYFKKMVIADRLVLITTKVFDNYKEYTGFVLLFALVCASIQLYCDFSGCMDIVTGISEVFSIELDKNFERPFFSKTSAEFWRRWHITLGTWFKDYVYMPIVISPRIAKISQMAKKRFGVRFAKSIMTIIPLMVVWLLTGLWHGTGANYVVWGVYWGCILIITNIFSTEIRSLTTWMKIDLTKEGYQIFQMVRTFIVFTIGRLITVPGSLEASIGVLKGIFAEFNVWIFFDETLYTLGLDRKDFGICVLAIILLWKVSCLQEKGIKLREKIASYHIILRWLIYYTAIFSVLIFGMYGSGVATSTFTYANY